MDEHQEELDTYQWAPWRNPTINNRMKNWTRPDGRRGEDKLAVESGVVKKLRSRLQSFSNGDDKKSGVQTVGPLERETTGAI